MDVHVRGLEGLLDKPIIHTSGTVTIKVVPYLGNDGFMHHEFRLEDTDPNHVIISSDPHFEDFLPAIRRSSREFVSFLAKTLYEVIGGDELGLDDHYNSLKPEVETAIGQVLQMYAETARPEVIAQSR